MTPVLCVDRVSAETYAEASKDTNPLHLSDDYASRTPFGNPIAHGALIISQAIDLLVPERRQIHEMSVSFNVPVFLEESFSCKSHWKSDTELQLEIVDGAMSLAHATLKFNGAGNDEGHSDKAEKRQLSIEDMRANQWENLGTYSFDGSASGLSHSHGVMHTALAAISMVAGTFCPGDGAVIKRIKIRSLSAPTQSAKFMIFYSKPKQRAVARGAFRCPIVMFAEEPGSAVFEMEFSAFQIEASPRRTHKQSRSAVQIPAVVVTGRSRGLGNAVARAFESRGLGCVGLQRSRDVVGRNFECDLSDSSQTRAAVAQVRKDFGSQNFLIVNSTMSLRALSIDSSHRTRIEEYVAKELRITLNTLTLVTQSLDPARATLLMNSSAFLDTNPLWEAPPNVGHYLAAKSAAEQLFRSLAKERPEWTYFLARLPPFSSSLAFSNGIDRKYSSSQIAQMCVQLAIDNDHRPGFRLLTGRDCVEYLQDSHDDVHA